VFSVLIHIKLFLCSVFTDDETFSCKLIFVQFLNAHLAMSRYLGSGISQSLRDSLLISIYH